MDVEALQAAEDVLVGRLFTLGGSTLFLIGSTIAVILAYRDIQRIREVTQK